MSKISRRKFLGKSALGFGTALIAGRLPLNAGISSRDVPYNLPLGFQVWTIKDELVRDFPGTLKKMAALGYNSVEMCSPPGYAGLGFEPLVPMKAKEMKKIINDAGLAFTSTHYGMDELRHHLDERIAFASESGQKQMILSSFGLPEDATLADWMKAAGELNKIGMKTKTSGIQMGYHNHHMEFGKLEGKLIYDELLKELDPDLVKMQFQVAVISIGYKAADYFEKYPGRFISSHLADWLPAEDKNVAIGKGVVNWNQFFMSAIKGGLKNIFVEMEPDTFAESATYLKSFKTFYSSNNLTT